jgi:GTP-binding protein HflX
VKNHVVRETKSRETAVAVGVIGNSRQRVVVREHLQELALLADTARVDVVHTIVQERERIDPATFVGSGKAKEIGELVDREDIHVVLFDDDLSPVQVRNLERAIKCKIIDRSGLILDIFAARAKSKEAMTQVELAQLQYLLPRLTRQWTHLSKQYGGVGTKGPGEQQIETDRRAIRRRISHLKEKLSHISNERQEQRKGRKDSTRVALVGYTNAGKSTLFRCLSGANVIVEDQLFATLDTTVRRVKLDQSREILLSDTVGFIRKLPSHLVASFRSTLAEVTEADIILHVVDLSHPQFADHIRVVSDTLDELNAAGKPTIYVFNKLDRVKDRSIVAELTDQYEQSVFVSAARGINLSTLVKKLLNILSKGTAEQTIVVEQSDYRTIAKLHEIAEITRKEYVDNTVTVHFKISQRNSDQLFKLLGQRTVPSRSR